MYRFPRTLLIASLTAVVFGFGPPLAAQQPPPTAPQEASTLDGVETEQGEATSAVKSVNVEPTADDEEIAARIERILQATEWFRDVDVQVDEGVAFLDGRTTRDEFRLWARDLARNTQDVVAVVNRIEVDRRPIWDFSPAISAMEELARDVVPALPLVALGFVVLTLTWFLAMFVKSATSWFLTRRVPNRLLRSVYANAIAIPVFVLGIYLVLRISGLTQLAVTVVGGTGLAGLVIGIAFRDITENFLASILISLQRPFEIGDQIDVDGHRGFVQSVTTRGTLLMTLDGNHVHIPNSTVYKSVLRNYTSNPNMRIDFVVGIGYDDSVAEAQAVLLDVIQQHPAALPDPEPLVLVENLGASTIDLRVYFWIDAQKFSFLKVRSAAIRQAKRALQRAGISMPDSARELVFPHGVPVTLTGDGAVSRSAASRKDETRGDESREAISPTPGASAATSLSTAADAASSSEAEGDLRSEAGEIRTQIENSRAPIAGDELLS